MEETQQHMKVEKKELFIVVSLMLGVLMLMVLTSLRDARTRTNPPDIRTLVVRTPEEWRPKLERLAAICEESYQLAVQRRLHDVLHGWLFVHAPLSFALFVLAAFHIVMALKY